MGILGFKAGRHHLLAHGFEIGGFCQYLDGLIIVDNDSIEDETIAFFKSVQTDQRVKVVKHPGPFNFSALTNVGVEHSQNEITGFINNDVAVEGPDWLTEMVSHAVRPEVGAVGAKLLYPDGAPHHHACGGRT